MNLLKHGAVHLVGIAALRQRDRIGQHCAKGLLPRSGAVLSCRGGNAFTRGKRRRQQHQSGEDTAQNTFLQGIFPLVTSLFLLYGYRQGLSSESGVSVSIQKPLSGYFPRVLMQETVRPFVLFHYTEVYKRFAACYTTIGFI